MTIKIIGSIFIIITSFVTGYYYSVLDKFRLDDLRQFKIIFTMLKSEVNFLSLPLFESFLEISKRIDDRNIKKIIENFSNELSQKKQLRCKDIWESSVMKNLNTTYLHKDDFLMLKNFGNCLGYLDKSQQINNIDLALNYIEEKETFLSLEIQKNSKIFRNSSIMIGFLIVIILF